MADDAHVSLVERLSAATPADRPERLAQVSDATEETIKRSGRGLDLSDAAFTSFDLRDVNLRRATLNRAQLHGTRLRGADLSEVTMVCPGMERTDLTATNLRGAYTHALAMQTCTLDGADLRQLRDATGCLFHGCKMRGTHLDSAHLSGTTFYQCDLSAATLGGANLQGVTINECLLDRAEFTDASVDQLTVTKSSMLGASFAGARGADSCLQRLTIADDLNLERASLPHLRLAGIRARGWRGAGLAAPAADWVDLVVDDADFRKADLSGARIRRCALPSANLRGGVLNSAQISWSALRGASLSGVHAENLQLVECDLCDVDASLLVGRCLVARDTDMTRISLVNANLYRAMITGDPPEGMSLREAVLEGAVLVQAYVAADLNGANLLNVNAAYSRFNQSSLRGARLDRANMYESTWVKVDVTGASLAGVRAPLFIDRCTGLDATAAPVESDDSATDPKFVEFASRLNDLLGSVRRGST